MASEKLKLLAYCDSPRCHSGFGQVARNLLPLIQNTGLFDLECFAISHNYERDEFGRVQEAEYDFPIMKANYLTPEEINGGFDPRDMYGKSKLLKLLAAESYDVFWSMQDPYVVEFLPDAFANMEKNLHKRAPVSMLYFPVDAANTHPEWLLTPLRFDVPVAYTQFGKQEVLNCAMRESDGGGDDTLFDWVKKANDLPYIHHGTNTEDFYPKEFTEPTLPEVKKELFGREDAFVVLNLNRNQPRKDIPRTMLMFRELKKEIPEAVLWLFMRPVDIGWGLDTLAERMGLTVDQDVFFAPYPEGKDAAQGLPIAVLNEAYNVADVYVTTSLGEGWGLGVTEAMACKTPVVVPDHTSFSEIIGENERGWLVECGKTVNDWVVNSGMYKEPLRPATDIPSMVRAVLEVYRNPEEAMKRAEAGYEWVKARSWSALFDRYWLPLFERVAEQARARYTEA